MILVKGLAKSRVWAKVSPSVDESKLLLSLMYVRLHVCILCLLCTASRDAAKTGDGDLCLRCHHCLVCLFDSAKQLIDAQQSDTSLQSLYARVNAIKNSDIMHCYVVRENVLMRKCLPRSGLPDVYDWQVVVPSPLHKIVLMTAHDDVGHMGIKKTYDRMLRYCYWPRVKRDIASHVKTFVVCQLTGKPNQTLMPVSLRPITVMCQATSYPAAYALCSIKVKPVFKALSQFISIFRPPKVIPSDCGTNFTSNTFLQILRLLTIQHNKSSARHPQSQGVLEHFHQTYKSLLRAYCIQLDSDWEDGLPWLLLAVREVTQASTGFSPNKLVFGHTVRSPVALLIDSVSSEPPQTD